MRVTRMLAVAATITTLAPLALPGCAYYNTFYLARRYYARSLLDVPYPLDKSDVNSSPQLSKSIELSQKLIQRYPKSKWVDDAYVLWGKSLIASDDPREAARMLETFQDQYPKSPMRDVSMFYLGVAYSRSHKYERALETFDRYLASKPKGELVPYAHYERSRVLLSLERPAEAAEAAGTVIEHYGGSGLVTRSRVTRADALFAQKAFDRAREDFRYLGRRAANDDDRLGYLLREADCLEGSQEYGAALAQLKDAIAHEVEPAAPDTAGGHIVVLTTGVEAQRYGRLLTRIGTVHLHAGRLDEALAAYRRVVHDYMRTSLAAEAQFRIGYAYETLGDDFDKARTEYGQVRDQNSTSSYSDDAQSRLTSLDRLAKLRLAPGDTLTRMAETEFVLAEQYLFQLDKPERALEEYRKVEQRLAGTPYAAKALNAQAWILSRKLKRTAEADSLFWRVVHDHPGTEAQLAARDYLESEGVRVPDSLIVAPEPPPAPPPDSVRADTTQVLTPPPSGSIPLGGSTPVIGVGDSLRIGPHAAPFVLPPIRVPGPSDSSRVTPGGTGLPQPPDSSRTSRSGADSTHTAPARPDTSSHPPAQHDTTHVSPPRDTTGSHR